MESSSVSVSLQGWESEPYQTRSLVLKEIQNVPPPLKKKQQKFLSKLSIKCERQQKLVLSQHKF